VIFERDRTLRLLSLARLEKHRQERGKNRGKVPIYMYICIHIYIHTDIHTYTHITYYTHTHTHTHERERERERERRHRDCLFEEAGVVSVSSSLSIVRSMGPTFGNRGVQTMVGGNVLAVRKNNKNKLASHQDIHRAKIAE